MPPSPDSPGQTTKRFAALVRKRWTVSLSLTALMLVIYYGFIVILAFRADLFARPGRRQSGT